jgi:NTE family protein
VIGTSAGAFAGVVLTSDRDLEAEFGAQSQASGFEIPSSMPAEVMAAYQEAFRHGGRDARSVGKLLGGVAKRFPEPVPLARRRAVVRARLPVVEWPSSILKMTAIDADTGELHLLDQASGVPLLDAASASGAVPGVWPLERFGGRSWIDGGMTSPTNALLAAGFERIIVIAPSPGGLGGLPSAADEVDELRASAEVLLVAPDDDGRAAIGPNPLDPARCGPAAAAGRRQATDLAAAAARLWTGAA